MEIHTIGFTQWTAEGFFERLRTAQINRLVDVRISNSSQLAAFAKKPDLEFFLRELVGADYIHLVELAPEAELLKAYRNKELSWAEYERRYLGLLDERNVTTTLDRAIFAERTVLLCSEHSPDRCHRRLAAELLAEVWGDVEVVHL